MPEESLKNMFSVIVEGNIDRNEQTLAGLNSVSFVLLSEVQNLMELKKLTCINIRKGPKSKA